MWKWIGGLIGLVVVAVVATGGYLSDKVYPRFDHAVIAPAQFDRRFAPAALRADFAYLTQTIERLHPDIAAAVDRAPYEQAKADILASLDHPMSRQEFFRVAGAINGQLHDGHTSLQPPTDEWRAAQAGPNGAPPLRLRFDAQGAVVAASLNPAIPAGARLVSLNGIDAATLRDRFAERTSGESPALRQAFAAEQLARQAWAEGLRAPYQVDWKQADGSVGQTTAPGVSFAAWTGDQARAGDGALRLEFDGDVAHLVIGTFDGPMGTFQTFLKQAFTQIGARPVRALVLDLRDNTGGSTQQSDLLQAYLSDLRLPAIASVTVRASPEVKAAYRTLLPEGFRWMPINSLIPELKGIQDAPDGGLFVSHPEAPAPKRRMFPNRLAFKGDLYVLISPVTYSTSVIFAQPLKWWKRATLVGEASGEPLTFYGDNYEFDLPNTKLQATVSHKAFNLIGSRGPRSRLTPDIATAPGEDAYRVALAHIRQAPAPVARRAKTG